MPNHEKPGRQTCAKAGAKAGRRGSPPLSASLARFASAGFEFLGAADVFDLLLAGLVAARIQPRVHHGYQLKDVWSWSALVGVVIDRRDYGLDESWRCHLYDVAFRNLPIQPI